MITITIERNVPYSAVVCRQSLPIADSVFYDIKNTPNMLIDIISKIEENVESQVTSKMEKLGIKLDENGKRLTLD